MMKVLSVCLTLCHLLTPTRSHPLNATAVEPLGGYPAICKHERQHCPIPGGPFCPECDADGNFLPQQCFGSTGFCWCVNVITGVEIPGTRTGPGVDPVECGVLAGVSFCPRGWKNHGDSCFSFIDTPKMWAEAEIYCQFEGAHLASIHSEEENRFVMSLTRGNTHDFPETWIGGVSPPGYWLWTDGSKFNYQDWFNHHDIVNPNQTCLKMNYEYDHKWFHDASSASYPFVCSKLVTWFHES